jgi:hypothetical protein
MFGDYRVARALGAGGMGEVYEAVQLTTGRRVALKVMSHRLESDTDRRRFLREGRLAASVSHPNTVYIFGSEEIEGRPVIIMELVGRSTLKDRVTTGGPLPVADAVDVVLAIIDGLEAAQSTDVLHRDIKPANCFIGDDGTVKVGDFGLSISTLARAESALTTTGLLIGTPSFASPEQLRGDPLDVRSDIYSVGATFYYLLTGELPHPAKDLVQLITQVLQQPPRAPHELRPEIPRGLSRVVLRALAKSPSARYADYHAMRRALQPFAAGVGRPAGLFSRFSANVVDMLVLALVAIPSASYDSAAILSRSADALGAFALGVAWQIVYFGVPEGLFGASAGKWLLNLRVARTNGSVPGLARGLARASVFYLPAELPFLIAMFFWQGPADLSFWHPLYVSGFILAVALFATIRKRNGFAAVHDLLTDTRVVQARAPGVRSASFMPQRTPQEAPATSVTGDVTAGPGDAKSFGPWLIEDVLADDDTARRLLARDPVLGRQAIIVEWLTDVPPVSAARRDLARAARNRWLDGERTTARSWDAFELPAGVSLRTWADALGRRTAWPVVLGWLRDIAIELRILVGDQSAFSLAIDNVWITRSGRIMLLDGPAPATGVDDSEDAHDADPTIITNAGARQFLHRVGMTALGLDRRDRLASPVPLHGMEALDRLAKPDESSLDDVITMLDEHAGRPATVPIGRRIVSVALPGALLLGFVIQVGISSITGMREKVESDMGSLSAVLTQRNRASGTDRQGALEAFLVMRHRSTLTDSAWWRDTTRSTAILRARPRIESLLDAPTPADTMTIENQVRADFLREARINRLSLGGLVAVVMGLTATILSVGSSLLFGWPPGLRMAGIAVVDRHNRRARRTRVALRSLIGWIVYLLLVGAGWGLAFWLIGLRHETTIGAAAAAGFETSIRAHAFDLVLVTPMLLVLISAAIWLARSPDCAPQDLVTRTFLVPH